MADPTKIMIMSYLNYIFGCSDATKMVAVTCIGGYYRVNDLIEFYKI